MRVRAEWPEAACGQWVIFGIGALAVAGTPTPPLTMSPNAWVTNG
jgi:hypothetical protein